MTKFRLVLQPILIAMLLALGVRSAVRLYVIPTSSMEPVLRAGDHILVTPYRHHDPQRGDVIVFRSPVARDQMFVKRVVAVPGDLVESRDGQLLIGGHSAGASSALVSQIVPADCYFVLGDNRANSFDSRNWGVLSRNLVVGRARLVLWSSGTTAIEPRANAAPRLETSSAPSPLRMDRLFRPIH
jgi:signal peptidase I